MEAMAEKGLGRKRRYPVAKVKGGWTTEEDEHLKRLVEQHAEGNWSVIARALNAVMHKPETQGRIGKQCRERWNHHLRPGIRTDAWTEEEEKLLVSAHMRYGNRWSDIARCIPGRTENAIKNHFHATLRRKEVVKSQAQPTALKSYMQSLHLLPPSHPHHAAAAAIEDDTDAERAGTYSSSGTGGDAQQDAGYGHTLGLQPMAQWDTAMGLGPLPASALDQAGSRPAVAMHDDSRPVQDRERGADHLMSAAAGAAGRPGALRAQGEPRAGSKRSHAQAVTTSSHEAGDEDSIEEMSEQGSCKRQLLRAEEGPQSTLHTTQAPRRPRSSRLMSFSQHKASAAVNHFKPDQTHGTLQLGGGAATVGGQTSTSDWSEQVDVPQHHHSVFQQWWPLGMPPYAAMLPEAAAAGAGPALLHPTLGSCSPEHTSSHAAHPAASGVSGLGELPAIMPLRLTGDAAVAAAPEASNLAPAPQPVSDGQVGRPSDSGSLHQGTSLTVAGSLGAGAQDAHLGMRLSLGSGAEDMDMQAAEVMLALHAVRAPAPHPVGCDPRKWQQPGAASRAPAARGAPVLLAGGTPCDLDLVSGLPLPLPLMFGAQGGPAYVPPTLPPSAGVPLGHLGTLALPMLPSYLQAST